MTDLNLIVSQIRQRLEILYQEIDRIEGSGGGGSPEDAYTKEQADALFVKKVAGKGLSTNDFTNAYMNQIGTNTTNIANLTTDVNSIFTQDGFSAAEGATLPAEMTDVLAKHRPFFMNGRTWYFLSESTGIVDYFSVDNNTTGYPELHYARIQEDNRYLMILESFGTDTTPTEDSDNFITSGGTYTALNSKMPLDVGTGLTTAGTWDLFTLPVGKYHRTSNVTAVANIPADLNVAFYCIIENTISSARKHITLYPAHVDGQSFFYTCLETGNGFGPWYKFEGTVVATANTNANLTSLSGMKSASLDVENPEDELI